MVPLRLLAGMLLALRPAGALTTFHPLTDQGFVDLKHWWWNSATGPHALGAPIKMTPNPQRAAGYLREHRGHRAALYRHERSNGRCWSGFAGLDRRPAQTARVMMDRFGATEDELNAYVTVAPAKGRRVIRAPLSMPCMGNH